MSQKFFSSVLVCTISLFTWKIIKFYRNMQRLTQKNIYSVSVVNSKITSASAKNENKAACAHSNSPDTVPLWLPKRKPQRQNKQFVQKGWRKQRWGAPLCSVNKWESHSKGALLCQGTMSPLQPVWSWPEAPVSWSILETLVFMQQKNQGLAQRLHVSPWPSIPAPPGRLLQEYPPYSGAWVH